MSAEPVAGANPPDDLIGVGGHSHDLMSRLQTVQIASRAGIRIVPPAFHGTHQQFFRYAPKGRP
jgi:hypothetical protein